MRHPCVGDRLSGPWGKLVTDTNVLSADPTAEEQCREYSLHLSLNEFLAGLSPLQTPSPQ